MKKTLKAVVILAVVILVAIIFEMPVEVQANEEIKTQAEVKQIANDYLKDLETDFENVYCLWMGMTVDNYEESTEEIVKIYYKVKENNLIKDLKAEYPNVSLKSEMRKRKRTIRNMKRIIETLEERWMYFEEKADKELEEIYLEDVD